MTAYWPILVELTRLGAYNKQMQKGGALCLTFVFEILKEVFTWILENKTLINHLDSVLFRGLSIKLVLNEEIINRLASLREIGKRNEISREVIKWRARSILILAFFGTFVQCR